MQFQLPYPPSVNTYWRKWRNRIVLSAKGRAYREAVWLAVRGAGILVPMTGPLRVEVEACAPDRRRRDLDNLWKALLDALAHAGAYADDSQIVDERIYWGPMVKGGRVVVDVDEVG